MSQQPEKSMYSCTANSTVAAHEVRAAHAADIAVDQRDIVAQVVGKDHLFRVAPQHTERAARAAAIAEPAAFLDLRAHLGVALNGPLMRVGKKLTNSA